jgi:hypothetical protein
MRGGGRASPTLTSPGLILPSSLNVRQKAAVATLCTLWYMLWTRTIVRTMYIEHSYPFFTYT